MTQEVNTEGWKYYNHALLPVCAPHEEANSKALNEKKIWKMWGRNIPLFARWTENFDCGYEAEWWYVVKDTPFNIDELKAKRRYVVNRGRKNFEVKVIDQRESAETLYEIQVDAFSAYSDNNKPKTYTTAEEIRQGAWDAYLCIGAFSRMDGKLCGYALLEEHSNYVSFSVQKVKPEYESQEINAALVDGILQYYEPSLQNGIYLCDGERNLVHQTSFQDYLIKYFGFRRAYCKLRMLYRPGMGWIVRFMRRFSKLINRFDKVKIIHLIHSVLVMDEIAGK